MPASQPSQSEPLETPSPILAHLGILSTIILTAAVLALLLYFAVTSPTPTRVMVVRSSSDWEGAELIVEGGNLAQPQQTTIVPSDHNLNPFFLWPGKYKLHVKSQGVEVYSHDFDLTTNPKQEIDLTQSGATTIPSTRPATVPAI